MLLSFIYMPSQVSLFCPSSRILHCTRIWLILIHYPPSIKVSGSGQQKKNVIRHICHFYLYSLWLEVQSYRPSDFIILTALAAPFSGILYSIIPSISNPRLGVLEGEVAELKKKAGPWNPTVWSSLPDAIRRRVSSTPSHQAMKILTSPTKIFPSIHPSIVIKLQDSSKYIHRLAIAKWVSLK